MITENQLAKILPRNRHLKNWARPLTDACAQFDIDTPLRQAHFLAQLAVESNELQTLEENLHYSPQRLIAVWPKRFRTIPEASRYARNPERLANFVYAGRLGNGDEMSRDGWRYRGRGAIQVTGRANYDAIGVVLEQNLLNTPDMLLEPKWAALSAAAFWARNGINELADKDDCVAVTKKVNGGTHGLAERERYLVKAKEVLRVGIDSGSVETGQSDPPVAHGAPGSQEAAKAQASGWFD